LGVKDPDEMIVWFSHTAVTTRRVADTALVVDALKDPNTRAGGVEFARALNDSRQLRVGVATNSKRTRRSRRSSRRRRASPVSATSGRRRRYLSPVRALVFATLRSRDVVHAIFEEYGAAATLDRTHDDMDRQAARD
jgi:hypothetical protein